MHSDKGIFHFITIVTVIVILRTSLVCSQNKINIYGKNNKVLQTVLNLCEGSNFEIRKQSEKIQIKNETNALVLSYDKNKDIETISIPHWLQVRLTPEKREYLSAKSEFNKAFKFRTIRKNPTCQNVNNISPIKFSINDTHSQLQELQIEEASNSSNVHNSAPNLEQEGFTETIDRKIEEEEGYFEEEPNQQFYFTGDGHFFARNLTFYSSKFCISEINSEEFTLNICFPIESGGNNSNNDRPASSKIAHGKADVIVPKCCPPGQISQFHTKYDTFPPSCMENPRTTEWSPDFYHVEDYAQKTTKSNEPDYTFKHVDMFKYCEQIQGVDFLTPNRKVPKPNAADLRILENGEAILRRTGNHEWDKPKVHRTNYITEYCIDGFIDSATWISNPPNYSEPLPREYTVIIFCHDEAFEPYVLTHAIIYFVIYFPSALILLVIVIVYGLVWQSQNVHGWTIAGFSFAMLMWFIFEAISAGAGIFSYSGISAGSTGCIFTAVMKHFFYISTFSWMTILNFDLWSTISSMTPLSARTKGEKRFGFYCIFGFGIPTLIISISLIIENEFGLFDGTVIRPQYGHASCALDKTSIAFYAIIPNFILFLFNAIFALLTLQFLISFKKNNKRLDKSSSATNIQSAIFFGKLFTLMGFTWVFELIPNLLTKDDVTWYWTAFQVYNVFQVVGLFWIFVFKKEIKEQLCRKYKIFNDSFVAWDSQFGAKTEYGSTSPVTTLSEIQSSH